MRPTLFAAPLIAVLSLGACADASPTTQRVGTGALGGAAVGGIVGSFSGNAGWGALGGAAVGAAGGALYDQHRRSQDRAFVQGYQRGRSGR